MLSKAGPMPVGAGWSFEAKWDGFRAIVSTVDGLTVRSRRGWHMEARLPELEALPGGLVLDGEIVAFREGDPWFPYVGDRILHGRDVPVVLIIFDLVHRAGESLLGRPYVERRRLLDALDLNAEAWQTSPVFDHGEALMETIVERGWEGVVAKKLAGAYRPGQRGWIKIKNRDYWRYAQDLELNYGSLVKTRRSAEAAATLHRPPEPSAPGVAPLARDR
jgi:bifunctional non-homologous end joining protein LigD